VNGSERRSVIQGILDNYVLGRGGLDYAAYALTQGRKVLEDRLLWSHNRQLASLLRRFGFGDRTEEQQIALWKGLLQVIHEALCQLDEAFVKTGQGENVRVVFDVDMGGLFYTRTGSHAILFGATLDQAEVNNRRCEDEMRSMVAEIELVCTAHGA
jgi:hypothetical protein